MQPAVAAAVARDGHAQRRGSGKEVRRRGEDERDRVRAQPEALDDRGEEAAQPVSGEEEGEKADLGARKRVSQDKNALRMFPFGKGLTKIHVLMSRTASFRPCITVAFSFGTDTLSASMRWAATCSSLSVKSHEHTPVREPT